MSNKAIPTGSLVLVTGINGYIGSHVAEQLLRLGYKVRGTARDSAKLEAILKALRNRNPGTEVEGLVVADMQSEHAFRKAVEGCSGIIHVASDTTLGPDPNKVISATVTGLRNALTAAASPNNSTVKRFVYTSSSIAAVKPTPNKNFHVDSSSWDDEDVRLGWAHDPNDPEGAFVVYGASKVEAERLAWKFMAENPEAGFTLNTVLPNLTIGPIIDPSQHGSTAGWVAGFFRGDAQATQIVQHLPPQYCVNVHDCAILHVAALLEPDIKDKRIFAFAETWNYASIVEVLKKIDPSKTHYPEPVNDDQDLSTVDNTLALDLLKRYDHIGFARLEETLREQLSA